MKKIHKIQNTFGINLDHTFDCGQCFRFDKTNSADYETEYKGVAFGKEVAFGQKEGFLYVTGADEKEFESLWRSYLSLDEDYSAIHRGLLSLSDNEALCRAVDYGKGIRILRQEPWETVCSFIISQNNNIPRIKGLIKALSEKAGEKIGDGVYAFPAAKAVAELVEEGQRELKTGFRAPYILDAAKKVASGELDLSKIYSMPTKEAEKLLCTVKGIGPKVADCALLFGFSKYDAFPVDVWIKRVLAKYFAPDFTPEALGEYAGVAQQVLFYYERWNGGENA